ncbi:MAG TPA: LysR family transcriptional regulator [Acidimicrobiia bacterium]|nr:LysR family transcriptional regulator [Acidimicrobiia bacterium]
MDVRHLEAVLAVAEEGSFTAAADRLHTVQSNVSAMVRQLEEELGVQLLVRGRRHTVPTEFGVRVLDRARAIRSEVEALHKDVSMLRGLETGHATLGVVGTVSRSVVPVLVAEMRRIAPGLSLRLTEGASERLAGEVAGRELASAIVTEPVSDPRLIVEHLRDEALVALVPTDGRSGDSSTVTLRSLARETLILPPAGNPLRDEVEMAARAEHVELRVPIEVEGVRLIADLVAAGAGISILPETAVPGDQQSLRTVRIARMPPRRLALVTARGVQLSLADQAVHDAVRRIVRATSTSPVETSSR